MTDLPVILFLVGAGFAFYIVAGYPLLLAVLAWFAPKPVNKRFTEKSVTILLAVYNGEKWIRAKIESILRLNYPRSRMQILVVSDGSTDQTDDMVAEFQPEGVELLRVPHGGKALALNAGMARATGEILFFTDVRQQLEPGALRHLVACLGDPSVGGASGQIVFLKAQKGAYLAPPYRRETPLTKSGAGRPVLRSSSEAEGGGEADVGLYWRFEKWLRDELTMVGSLPVATGCIYAVRGELARPLPADALVDDAYQPLAVIFQGYRFVFERNAVAYDYPTQLAMEFQRKVRTLAGLFQIIRSYPRLLNVFTGLGFHFFSYKLGRLLLPYALILVALNSFWLPYPWAKIAIAAQLLLYGLAAVDHWVPAKSVLKRLSAVCCAFAVLMGASLCAGAILFVPAGRLWKRTRVKAAVESGN